MQVTFSIIMVFMGASLGGALRFLIGEYIASTTRLPGWVAILCANLLGSLVIGGSVATLALQGNTFPQTLDTELSITLGYALFVTGFCGGLTTYSTFSLDNVFLSIEKKWGQLFTNLTLSITLCTLAVWAGLSIPAAIQS